MPQYLTPGIYVEEVEAGAKPIESAATNVVGFLGVAEKGQVNEPKLVTNWSHYTREFGSFHKGGWLAHSVFQFFMNGGTKCYINNLAKIEGEEAKPAAKAAGKAEEKGAAKAVVAEKDITIKNPDNMTKLIIGKDEGPGRKTGLFAFDGIDDISIVCAPGVVDAASQDAILSHCERHKFRVAVLDAPETIEKGLDTIPMPRDSIMGAYYFPWVKMYDTTLETEVFAPPCGGVAGIYARVDSQRGVHKAPANEIFAGITGLKYVLTNTEQEFLNPKGINCIREFKGRGIRVWGARTFSSNPEWRYVNVRRLFCMVEQALQNGTNWVVFEPNTRGLWKNIVRNVTGYLLRLWKDGMFFGDTPEEAFFVRCDDELNPPESIDAGYVICEVGIAPAKPAEFVVFRVSQKTLGQA